MQFGSNLTTAEICSVFTEEVSTRRGRVTESVDDGRRLFARSVLPHSAKVRPGDELQGGVALKAVEDEVWLYPYLFRLVCQNGAIIVRTLEERALVDLHVQEPEAALECIREAVRACSEPVVFEEALQKVRVVTASELQTDLLLALLPHLARLTGSSNGELIAQVLDQFFGAGDRSQFGLANAVTAVARETRDPAVRWGLEELGGAIAVDRLPRHPVDGVSARAQPNRLVAVG
jgi:hypothetical protein